MMPHHRHARDLWQPLRAGEDPLSKDQKCTLKVAWVIREGVLQQNGFAECDFMCPGAATIGMMTVIVTPLTLTQAGTTSTMLRVSWSSRLRVCTLATLALIDLCRQWQDLGW
mgnify:CR=1 FL=1